jgi:hypothetical protein
MLPVVSLADDGDEMRALPPLGSGSRRTALSGRTTTTT